MGGLHRSQQVKFRWLQVLSRAGIAGCAMEPPSVYGGQCSGNLIELLTSLMTSPNRALRRDVNSSHFTELPTTSER